LFDAFKANIFQAFAQNTSQTAKGIIGIFTVENQLSVVPSHFKRFAYKRIFLVNVNGNKIAEQSSKH
nr:hypothetical protein [Flavobacterium sp.]